MYVHTNVRTDHDLRRRAHSRKFPHTLAQTLAQTRTQRPRRCPAARREKPPARLWSSRWNAAQWMRKISMWEAKYISPQKGKYNGTQTSSKNAYGTIAIYAMRRLTKATPCAHAEIHNTPANGADLTLFFFFEIIQKYRPK